MRYSNNSSQYEQQTKIIATSAVQQVTKVEKPCSNLLNLQPNKRKQSGHLLIIKFRFPSRLFPWTDADDLSLESLESFDFFDGLNRLLANERCQAHALQVVLVGHIGEILVGPAAGAEVGAPNTRAVELTYDVYRGAVRAVGGDEVASPDEGQGLVTQLERIHEEGDVVVDELGLQVRVLRGVRLEESGDVDSAHGREATLHGLLVNDLEQSVLHHEHAHLALRDAGEEALVHKLASSFLSTLEILPREDGLPLAGGAAGAVDAKLDELAHGVVLGVVVVHLHQLDLVAVLKNNVSKVGAVVLAIQPAQPDALAG
mmetsp:Transcript_11678/g.18792  ORF Transcript_11678/g.18792 Transcript_11678/m.18792 type:complete len:315 (+) Transcript_11678:54-998(+)